MAASAGVLGVTDMLDNLSDGSASMPDLDGVLMESSPFKRLRLKDDGDDQGLSPGCNGAEGNKRCVKYFSKIGIGVQGIEISEAAVLLGSMYSKIMNKKCGFCHALFGSPDPIFPERTRSWFKPEYGGNICAYCGFTKVKLYAGKSAPEVLTLITTQQDKHTRFFQLPRYSDRRVSSWKQAGKGHREEGSGARVGHH